MFKASIHFANRDGFYKTGGYEKIYNIAGKFKKCCNTTIHSFGEHDDRISFNFKENYCLIFDLSRDKYYLEIHYDNVDINDFKDKYEYMCKIIKEEFSS